MNRVERHTIFRRQTDLIIAIIGVLAGILIVLQSAKFNSSFELNLNMVPPPQGIERFTFGYRDTVADLLWVRVIQDVDICEAVKGGIAHVKGIVRSGPACKRGWVYHMLDAITTLAPRWALPYKTGSLVLSVVVDDIEGATQIFEKGIAQFPRDYTLLYNASYHYIWEVKDPKRAAELLITAAKNGGPAWFYSLAGKMYSQAGQAELAKGVLENALRDLDENDKSRPRILERLAEVDKILKEASLK